MGIYPLLGKIIIEGEIILKTGLHIGVGNEYSAIGAVDSVIVRDSITKRPYIPGSSLKGKMRYLLSRYYASNSILPTIEEESDEISRLFGQSRKKVKNKDNDQEESRIILSRLQFFDLFMNDDSAKVIEKLDTDLYLTEIKYENTINRITAVATPRQIERAIAGSIFDFRLDYNIESEEEIEIDLKNISLAISLLEDDYLGGHGTRGYGRIKFNKLSLENKEYNKNAKNINKIVKEAEKYFNSKREE